METRKLIVYGLIIFFLFIIVYLAYLIFISKNQEIPVKPQVTPISTFLPSPTIFRANLPEKITASGISVDNFYRNAQEIMPNSDAIIKDNPDFHIVYYARGDYFLISVDNSPFEEVRKKAENEFLRILNIKEDDACKLKIRIITQYRVNPDFADNDYPLSFCQ
ncbi:MAG TPA: hypothetical protein VJC17_03330 [Candidatus Dojkabacteria bacterium]|nr:hypothetical protein [Candidatus Dojkabacteria bacterium]